MALTLDVQAASRAVDEQCFKLVTTTFDVFSRPDMAGEIIVDTGGWAPADSPLQDLAAILGEPAEELVDLYLILFVE